MSMKIYKYLPKDVLSLVFSREGFCSIKFSMPKDYNDPYELFLGVDLNVPTGFLATYREIINELPQYPTTCFSKSPVVAPMWAHYANNHSGFVLEFDAERIKDGIDGAVIRDIEYREEADERITEYLGKAAVARKPRHAVWLQNAVVSGAYFSKYTCWSYEQECRLVVPPKAIELVGESMILFAPLEFVTSIIAGSKASAVEKDASKAVADEYGLAWYEGVIGKSVATPFLVDNDRGVFVFNGQGISTAESICDSCREPIAQGCQQCVWCRITEEDEREAARGNPFRVLDHYGLLDGYMETVSKIERSRK